MFGRKTKTEPEQAADRRQVQRGKVPQAFSYYASRVPTPMQSESRATTKKAQLDVRQEKTPSRAHSFFAGLSFWLLIAVVIICAVKVLALNTNPKIVIVSSGTSTSSYLQPTGIYAAAAQKLLAGSLTNHSKLTVNTESVSSGLKSEFPELEDVSMSIPLVSNRPVIYVQPAVPSVILQSLSGNYALGSSGDVLTRAKTLPSDVPLIVDQSSLTPKLGKQVVPSSTISFVHAVAYQFSAAHLTISTFVLPSGSPYELDVRLEGRPYVIRFNLEEDALTQSGAAIATVQQLGGTVPANYIDVRVPGRVYYK